MSGKGNCYDNAYAESFFHTLKTELIYQNKYQTREDAKQDVFEYIEVFYNRKRRHSAFPSFLRAGFILCAKSCFLSVPSIQQKTLKNAKVVC